MVSIFQIFVRSVTMYNKYLYILIHTIFVFLYVLLMFVFQILPSMEISPSSYPDFSHGTPKIDLD